MSDMSNQKLMALLNAFNEAEKSEEKMVDLFVPIAKQMLYGGCLEVYSKGKVCRRIYPQTVEFYYHEETEGGLKDYIVYHRNKVSIVDGREEEIDYFPLGAINAHRSGIDITFEKEGQYRASALIRAYKVEFVNEKDAGLKKYLNVKSTIDPRSTYLYDYLFTGLQMPITFKWKDIDFNPKKKLETGLRKNVHEYRKAENGKLERTDIQDTLPWAFSINKFPQTLQYPPKKVK